MAPRGMGSQGMETQGMETRGVGTGGHEPVACDVLVIGSGAGGAVVADRLTAAGRDVVLVEEGPDVPADLALSPAEAMRRQWRCGGLMTAFGAPLLAYAEGRCVGGGTEINAAILQRIPAALLDAWSRRYAIAEYGADALAPYFREAEALLGASPPERPQGSVTTRFAAAAAALGWDHQSLTQAKDGCLGGATCAEGCPPGRRSMASAVLPRARARGLRVIADCRVVRLERRGARVVRVLARRRDGAGPARPMTFRPEHVFLCAGAIHTPALLRRSGLGRNVGASLRAHPVVRAAALFPEPLTVRHSATPLSAVTEFMPDLRLGGSILLPGYLGMMLAEDWQRRGWLWAHRERVGLYYAMARAEGRGQVIPIPGLVEPLVRYRATDDDWELLRRGLLALSELLFAAGAERVVPSLFGHAGWTSPGAARAELAAPLRRSRAGLATLHLFSSCPPGEEAALTATDSFGRLRGLSNLTVADASQLPEAPGVNPQLGVMAHAARAADAFLAASDAQARRRAARDDA